LQPRRYNVHVLAGLLISVLIIRLRQLMHIYVTNNPAKCHRGPI